MTINEIRESGLLELYVLDMLQGSELTQVKQALARFPELKSDLNIIERSLQSYAMAHTVQPSPSLKDKILQEAINSIPPSDNTTPSAKSDTAKRGGQGGGNGLLSGFLGLLSLLSAFFAYSWYSSNQKMQAMEAQHKTDYAICDSIREASDKQYALYQDLSNPNNRIIQNATTEKYPDTEIYFYHNEVDKKNYLQLASLPPIDNNTQSYQLWSIIGNDPPVPLDVFQSDGGEYHLPVLHVEGTQVYAITIETKGGVQSPTLEDIIGTFTI